MAVYKAVPDSISDAVPSVLGGSEVPVDKTASEAGWGPAEYGGGVSLKQQVPGDPTNSPVGELPVVPVSRDQLLNRSRTGPYGRVPQGRDFFIQGRAFRGHGPTQGAHEGLPPVPGPVAGSWTDVTDLQTNDIHSYDTDTRGWRQLHPNNRIAKWLTFGHSNAANKTYWQNPTENVGSYPLANPGADYNVFDNMNVGGYQIADGSRADLWVPEGSNVAYETPQPPNTTTASAVSQASSDPASGYW